MKPSHAGYSVIPNQVLRNKNLSNFDKIFYIEILNSSDPTSKICLETNKYFLEVMNIKSENCICRSLKSLRKNEIIKTRLEQGYIRKIFPMHW